MSRTKRSLLFAAAGAISLLLSVWLRESAGLRAPWSGLLVALGLVAYVAAGAVRPGWPTATAAALSLTAAFLVGVGVNAVVDAKSEDAVEYEGGAILFPIIVLLPGVLVAAGAALGQAASSVGARRGP